MSSCTSVAQPWDWYCLSTNPNITKDPFRPWNVSFRKLSRDPFLINKINKNKIERIITYLLTETINENLPHDIDRHILSFI